MPAVLSPDVRFEGFTATDWIRFLSLFRPRTQSGTERDPLRPRGGIVAVHSEGRLRKLLHTQAGRLRLSDLAKDFPIPADELARRHQTSWSAILEARALDTMMDRFGQRCRRGDDLTVQSLLLFELARDEMLAGRISFWPRRLAGLMVPTASMVRGTLDSVCPMGRSLVVGLFEEGELWTCIAIRRGVEGIDTILGPDELRVDMGLLAGDWRRDYRHLLHAVQDRLGPVALACSSEVTTLRRLLTDATPGSWARAVAVRDVILSPVPGAVAIPLGIDAGRAAMSMLKNMVDRLDPLGIAVPTAQALLDAVGGEPEVTRVLGFNPLELLRRLVSRDR